MTLLCKNDHQDWNYIYFSSRTKIKRMIASVNKFTYSLRNFEKNSSHVISFEEFDKKGIKCLFTVKN